MLIIRTVVSKTLQLAFKATLLLFLIAQKEDKKERKDKKEKYAKKGKDISGGKEEKSSK